MRYFGLLTVKIILENTQAYERTNIMTFGFVDAFLLSVSSIFLKPSGNTMWKILIMRFVMVLKLQKLTVHIARIEDQSNALGRFTCNSKERLCTPT